MMHKIDLIIEGFLESQTVFVEAIRPFAPHQDYRLAPTEWSFREVAARMVLLDKNF